MRPLLGESGRPQLKRRRASEPKVVKSGRGWWQGERRRREAVGRTKPELSRYRHRSLRNHPR